MVFHTLYFTYAPACYLFIRAASSCKNYNITLTQVVNNITSVYPVLLKLVLNWNPLQHIQASVGSSTSNQVHQISLHITNIKSSFTMKAAQSYLTRSGYIVNTMSIIVVVLLKRVHWLTRRGVWPSAGWRQHCAQCIAVRSLPRDRQAVTGKGDTTHYSSLVLSPPLPCKFPSFPNTTTTTIICPVQSPPPPSISITSSRD